MTNEETNKIIRKAFRINDDDVSPLANHRFRSTRVDLAKLFNTLGYKIGAEIGVASGRHSIQLFREIDGLKLICVDPWKEHDGVTAVSQTRIDKGYNACIDRLKDCNVEYMRMSSVEASEKIKNNSLDFVYIDAGHDFDNHLRDIITWSPKVREGGIVSGRNYHKYHRNGAMAAVNVYTRNHMINEWYVTSHRGKDPYPSWFWVKGEDSEYG